MVWVSQYVQELSRPKIKELEARHNMAVKDTYALKEVLRRELDQWEKDGVIALKISFVKLAEKNSAEENRILQKIIEDSYEVKSSVTDPDALRSALTRYYCELAGSKNLVMAVHAGVWDDFRKLDPTNILISPMDGRHNSDVLWPILGAFTSICVVHATD